MGAGNGGRFRRNVPYKQVQSEATKQTSVTYDIPTTTGFTFAYISAQKIGMQVFGMIPNTRLSVFFDSINITKLCAPALPLENIDSKKVDVDFQETGKVGDPIITNANGMGVAVFYVPENTFEIGTKNIAMFNYTTDGDSYETKYSNNSCKAFSSFYSSNFSGKETDEVVILSTSPVDQGSSSNTVSGRTGGAVTFNTQPLCQSFYVGSDMADNQDGIYISSVDLYFSSKSNTHPVSIEIRTMSNDTPTEKIIPYSTVIKTNVNIAATATSTNSTKFVFEKPVFLKAGYYYALAINPGGQSPDYSVWTATVGKSTTTGTVNNNWGQGKLYKSTTNGSNWTPVPNQFLKFNINRTKYDSAFIGSGRATIVNGDYEFLSFINPSNIGFVVGEYVYQQPTAHIAICNVSTATNQITLSSVYTSSDLNSINPNPLSDFTVNDHIVICGSFPTTDQQGLGRFNYNLFGNSQTLKVTTVVNGQTLVVGYANGSPATGLAFTNTACYVYKVQPGEVTYDPSSRVVTGIGTKFDEKQNTNESDQSDKRPLVIHAANSTVARYEVLWPSAINSSNTITLKNNPLNTIPVGAKAIPINAPVGRVVDIDYTRNLITLDKSTANSLTGAASSGNVYATPSFFAPGRTLVGTKSGATAIVSGIHNIVVNSVQPILQTTTPQGTEITYTANLTTSAFTDVNVLNYDPGITNYFTNNQIVIASRSTEVIKMNNKKSFILNAKLTSSSTVLSPTIDLITGASLLSKTNIIGASAFGEHKNNGNAKSKYISKVVTLSEDNDAEDINVYLTAYKPLGTDLIVFAKILNASDNEVFEDKDWSVLRQVTNLTLYSDSENPDDFKEYQYTFPKNPVAVPLVQSITTNNSVDIIATNSDTTWENIFANGELVVLYSDIYGSNHEVNKIQNVVSNTQITLVNPVGLANTTSGIISLMPFPHSAFKNSNNGDIVRYYNTNGSAFDSFRKFAIKIVFTAQDTNLVPKVDDIRVLALSV